MKRRWQRCYVCEGPLEELHSSYYWCFTCNYARSKYQYCKALYDKTYANEYINGGHEDEEFRFAKARFAKLKRYVPRIRSVIDVGCGAGYFVAYLNKEGTVAVGYDINKHYKKFHAKLGIVSYFGNVPQRRFQVVTAFDSFEHLEDPLWPLDVFKPLYFYLILPIYSAPFTNFLQDFQDWCHCKPQEHLHAFSDTAIRQLFQNRGFQLLHCSSEDVLGRQDIKTYIFKRGTKA